MSNKIVIVNVSQQIAPTPATLQESGAFVSQGATSLAVGAFALLTQQSTLTSILTGALALASITWASGGGGVATATAASPHGFTIGDTIELTISGSVAATVPGGYNGTFLCTITTTTAFTYPLTSNPGTETTPGIYTPENVAELVAMNTTYWAQPGNQAVYVLELGPGNAADGVTALTAYVTANPNSAYVPGEQGFFYIYEVPRPWASEPTFLTMAANFTSPTAQTYFFVTGTTGNYTAFGPMLKSVLLLIEAPGLPATEFSVSADFQHILNYNPSSANRVTPNAFAFLYGVTAYPLKGNSSLLTTLEAANVNVIGTGAEGGISNTIMAYGTTMDGNDFTYWYSVDWVQINSDLNVANAVINGSNNPSNPLYYNQDGINRLQGVLAQTLQSAISYGLALGQLVTTQLDPITFANNVNSGIYAGQVVVNAVPFPTYSAANPSDYSIGKYGGLQVVYTPARGFRQIIINVNVSNLAA